MERSRLLQNFLASEEEVEIKEKFGPSAIEKLQSGIFNNGLKDEETEEIRM